MLEVNGNVQVDGQLKFADGSSMSSAFSLSAVGAGTSGAGGLVVPLANLDPALNAYPMTSLENTGKLLIGSNYSGGLGELDLIENRNLGPYGGFTFYDYDNSGNMTPLLTIVGPGNIAGPGNVGIGTATPKAKLEVNGSLLFTQPPAGGKPSGASITFSDATVQSTAWNGTTLGGTTLKP